jgi:hypothetical protein
MAYVPKAGSLSLFKNDRKERDSHPDYKGDGMDLQGNPVWISAWIKDSQKGKFMSISIQKKDDQRTATTQAARQEPAPNFSDMDDDIAW